MNKYKNIYVFIVMFIVCSLSIGFSAFESNVVVEDIAATVRVQENIRITAFELYNATSSAKSTYHDYAEELLLTNINLPNADSTITYQVTVTNYGNMEMGIYEFNNLPSNLTYETSGYQMQDKICESTSNCTLGVSKTFYLIIKYKENGYNSANTNYSLNIGVDFRNFYKVTYENITNNGYPTEIIAGGNLVINFDNSVSSSPIVSLGEQVVSTSLYSFADGILTYNNVTNNVKISGMSLSSIEITSLPKNMYNIGDKFDPNGMVVTATYSDGSTKEVTSYTYTPNGYLNENNTVITISYTEKGKTCTTTQQIQVGYIITITGKGYGGSMVTGSYDYAYVTINDMTYSSSSTVIVSSGTVIKLMGDNVSLNGTGISSSEHVVNSPMYIHFSTSSLAGGAYIGYTFAVTAIDFISSPPTVAQISGEAFNPTGMVVTHIYADGTKEIVNDYTYVSETGGDTLTYNDNYVTISYVRNGQTYSTNLPIEVTSSSSGCFTTGTLITLTNGIKKPIEDITYDDELLAWDFNTGRYAITVPSLIETDDERMHRVLNLEFDDGTVVSVIDHHGFFDKKVNDFVFIDETNVNSYIGHEFIKMSDNSSYKTVKLKSFSIEEKVTRFYTIQTAVYNNCIAEDMFTLTPPPDGYKGWFNFFEIGKNMKYDEFKKRNDIAKYGLYSYEEFSEYVTYEQFIAFNGPYLKVLVGKGYLTREQILDAVSYYLK